jgi:signal transduction histidine kinase
VIGLRRALIGIGLAGIAAGGAALALVVTSNHVTTRGVVAALGLWVGWSFIGTGLFAWWRRPANRFGALLTAVGFAWFLGGLTASDSALVFTIGMVLSNLVFAVGFHALLAYPGGRLQGKAERILIGATYAICLISPGILFADPKSPDSDCSGCPDNLLMIHRNDDLTLTLFDIQSFLGVVVVIGMGLILIRRWRRATPVERSNMAPVLWCGIAFIVLLAVTLSSSAAGLSGASDAMLAVAMIVFGSVPYAFLIGLLRTRIGRAGAVSDLVERLGTRPEDVNLRDELAKALGDPTLDLAYWLPSKHAYVDAQGNHFELPGDGGRRVATKIERDGQCVAAIVHDATLVDQPELVSAAGGAVALALENERLDAELRARVAELQTSRARLVEIGLAERRRLERDLHDGAQQRLVSLSLRLGLARSKIHEDPDQADELLAGAADELQQALAELRELARGIHPAVLADHGLDAALDVLTDRAPIPVDVVSTPEERLPAPVEAAAYFVVAEALTNVAKYANADHATVMVERVNGHATIEVSDDGVGGADPKLGSGLRGLADRVAALDGRLELTSPPGRGTTLRAEIPCA